MNISDDQNTITIEGNTYEAVLSEHPFCRDCQLDHVLQFCDEIPCRSYERKDKRRVIFKQSQTKQKLKEE